MLTNEGLQKVNKHALDNRQITNHKIFCLLYSVFCLLTWIKRMSHVLTIVASVAILMPLGAQTVSRQSPPALDGPAPRLPDGPAGSVWGLAGGRARRQHRAGASAR